jgi:pyridinium-3,5-biscarboxylic acid mononucleotide synthase
MNVSALLDSLLAGRISRDQALAELAGQSVTADLGDVQLDLDRSRRCGFPEVVYGEGKRVESLARVIGRLNEEGHEALITRVAADAAALLSASFPSLRYNDLARTVRVRSANFAEPPRVGRVAVVTAGTTDLPVAEEARETLDWMGVATDLIADVGVAGPHRLPAQLHRIRGSDAVVVVAGMEAALPSVVAGHVDCPVIGVPTSVGYGANFGGLAAVLSMLNSCAANVVVVNIDAGFKGGYVAGMIARRSGG